MGDHCPFCDLWTQPPSRQHVARCRDHHENGLRTPPLRYFSYCRRWDGDILLVGPRDPIKHRRHVQEVALRANHELRFDFGIYDPKEAHRFNTHALVYRRGARSLGLLLLQQHGEVWEANWGGPSAAVELPRGDAVWVVALVWVVPTVRRNRLATSLVEAALKFCGVSAAEVAWRTPFGQAGQALVRKYCPERLRMR